MNTERYTGAVTNKCQENEAKTFINIWPEVKFANKRIDIDSARAIYDAVSININGTCNTVGTPAGKNESAAANLYNVKDNNTEYRKTEKPV